MINKDYFHWNPLEASEDDWLSSHLDVGTETPGWAQIPNPLFDPCSREGRSEMFPDSPATTLSEADQLAGTTGQPPGAGLTPKGSLPTFQSPPPLHHLMLDVSIHPRDQSGSV